MLISFDSNAFKLDLGRFWAWWCVLVWVLLKTSVLGHLDKKKAPISRGLDDAIGWCGIMRGS